MNRVIIHGDISAPFQHIYVYKDGERVDTVGVLFEDIPETTLNYLEKYNLSNIDLSGARVYTEKIEQDIKKAMVCKYNSCDITFKYV